MKRQCRDLRDWDRRERRAKTLKAAAARISQRTGRPATVRQVAQLEQFWKAPRKSNWTFEEVTYGRT
jgi:hypothetical protein